MKVLFDQGTPAPLRHHLAEHSIDTAFEMGWSNLRNGELLDRAEEGNYELLITTDQQLRHQHNFATRQLAVLVLLTTSWPRIQSKVSEIRQVINRMQPSDYREVSI